MAIDLDVHGNTKPLEAAVQAAVNRIRRQPIKITVDDKGATQPLGNMKRGADEFTKSMEAANARILAFGASMAIINGVANAFKGMVKNLVEVEKAMADVNVVMGLSAQNLEKFSDGLFKVAKETGAAFRVAADAATEYARQGLGVEESLKRTRDALVLTRLTGMDSAEAVKSLTAAMNTYGTQIKDTTQLVSKFAAVDVKFAVSAQDFADAISRTGQSAQSAGVSIDELVGIVTAAQQKTARGGAVIGNALKTIFTKTGKTDTLNQLENLGIAVRDLEGNTIGAQRILNDLANTFDTLSAAQKAQITQTMGGLFHINILKAVLSDAAKQNGIMAEATKISAGATDEAIQKNEELRKTMSAVATETGLAIKQVSTQIGEIALAPGMEKILNSVKSLAEGLSGVLGDGESTGSSFATGLLKGIGNVITGPGLVVLAGVFFKLFGQALKFTKESLTSLVGVTTEKQKQKAIQTSLVALFGQNAALNKEMLRTDIGRTEKEKIILGLLKAQVLEAKSLSTLTAGMAGTLYRKGYGANLTPVGKKASGHIPNYANPERAQAAQGGYAAGNIRSMNMPGEGSVIYNSAEKVKNFKGMSQPAIMPPYSSKAGKNYQQAFGSIHGFDPYAAGGYIPNFAKTAAQYLESARSAKTTANLTKIARGEEIGGKTFSLEQQADAAAALLERSAAIKTTANSSQLKDTGAISLAAMLVPKEGYKFKAGDKPPYASYGTGKGKMTWPVYTLRSQIQKPMDLTDKVKKKFESVGSKYSTEVSRSVGGGNVTANKFWKEIENDRAGGGKGAWKAAVGAIFEASLNAAIGYKAAKGHPEQGDFDVRGGENLNKVRELFDLPPGIPVADYKSSAASKGNRKSFRDKVLKEGAFKAAQKKNKTRAYGHIPNFADPLSDAIGREKAAGVPVSQIRVGSHGALMGKGNPLGLGVTNTHDEPNGLRDVFGANGFVPNYKKGFIRKGYNKLNKRFSKTSAGKVLDSSAGQMGVAIGLPMAAAATDGAALSGALQGAGTGAMIGSMFGPLGTAVGAAGGALLGFIGGLNDAEKATKEKAKQDREVAAQAFSQTTQEIFGGDYSPSQKLNGKTLLATFESVPLHMGIAMQEMREQLRDFKGTGREKLAEQERLKSELRYKSSEDLDREKKSILASLMKGRENEVFRGREKLEKIGLKQEAATGLEIIEAIKVADPKQIQKFFNDMKMNLQERAGSERDLTRAVILQLNTQKAIVDAQHASKLRQLEINTKYSSIVDSLTLQERVIGSSITEQQKANFTYTKAMQNAARKYEVGEEASGFKFRESMLDFAKGGNVIAQLKTVLASGKSIDSDKVNLNQELSNLSSQELSHMMAKLDLTDEERLSLEQIVEARIRNLELLKKEKEIAEQRAKTEKYINDTVGKRNDIISKEKNNLKSRSSALSHTQTMRGFGVELSSARRAADFGGGYKTHRQKAEFDLNESSINTQLKITEIKENNLLEIQRKKLALKKEELAQEEMLDFYKKKEVEGHTLSTEEETYYKSLEMGEKDRLRTIKIINQEIDQQEEKSKGLIENAERLLEVEKQISKENLSRAQRLEALEFAKTQAQYQDQISSDEFEIEQGQLRLSRGPGYISDFQKRRNDLSNRGAREKIGFASMEEGARLQISTLKESHDYEKLASEQSRYEELYSKLGKEYVSPKEMNELGGLQQTLKNREETLSKIEEQSQMINSAKDSAIEKTKTLLNLEKQILEQEIAHKTGPGAFSNGMTDSFEMMRDQVSMMDYELGKRIPTAFADGLSGALIGAINGTKSLKEGLMDAAVSFLSMMQQAMMQKLVYQSMGAMGFSKGGNVRKYSKGGGVPAMVSNGEYVMSRDAVNKYGGSFMHGINAGGQIPGFSKGGMTGTIVDDSGIGGALVMKEKRFQEAVENHLLSTGKIKREAAPGGPAAQGSALASNFGGGRGFDSGRLYQRKAMSSSFYAQSGNVGLGEDTSAMQAILSEEERVRQEIKAKREAAKAKRRQILGMVASTVLMAGLSKGFGSGSKSGSKIGGFGEDLSRDAMLSQPSTNFNFNPDPVSSSMAMRLGNPFGLSYGGSIRKYASGGHIAGKSGIDQIPAMLSEGEYVIRASSARQIGKPMLDQINAGKFNEGGSVSEIAGSSETGSTGGNTNNISISVNMERGSSNKQEQQSESTGKNPSDKSKEEQGSAKLAERIKQQVVSVIIEEQRPGGLLSD
jgi:TP901 family phage tail tape measure protein